VSMCGRPLARARLGGSRGALGPRTGRATAA